MRTREERLRAIGECGVVAIIRLERADHLLAVARAIKGGGVAAIEFTLTTPGALDVLAQAARELGDEVILGAGTVLDPETARASILAGAQFIVAPTVNAATIELCRRYSVIAMPGAFTPTEILTAWEAGADVVKVFPANTLGPGYLRDVLAPLPQVRLLPTGGIDEAKAGEYMRAGAFAVGVGGKVVDRRAVEAGDWAALTEAARRLVAAVRVGRAT